MTEEDSNKERSVAKSVEDRRHDAEILSLRQENERLVQENGRLTEEINELSERDPNELDKILAILERMGDLPDIQTLKEAIAAYPLKKGII